MHNVLHVGITVHCTVFMLMDQHRCCFEVQTRSEHTRWETITSTSWLTYAAIDYSTLRVAVDMSFVGEEESLLQETMTNVYNVFELNFELICLNVLP